jgi:hypothetical protein
VHNQEQIIKGDEIKSPKEGYAWCLPWSRGNKLALAKLGVPLELTALGPI